MITACLPGVHQLTGLPGADAAIALSFL